MPTTTEVVEFLEEKNSLRLGESPWDPGELSEDYEIRQVDWGTLFGGKPGAPLVIIPGNQRNVSPGVTTKTLGVLGHKIHDLARLLG
jgi:hypothetical protein